MTFFRIEAKTEGREIYYVEAETEADARRAFEDGDVPKPSMAEVLEVEIVEIVEAPPDRPVC